MAGNRVGNIGNDRLKSGPVTGIKLTENKGHILQDVERHSVITAGVIQTQEEGFQLLSSHNEVSTVANENDAVILPIAVNGRKCEIMNNGANILQIFPAVGDDLGSGVNVSQFLQPNKIITYAAYNDTDWRKF